METDAERAVWARATLDLMSEEEDGVVDGRAVWVVSPPPQRDEELSALCQVLQQRKDKRSAAPYLRVQRHTLGQSGATQRPAPLGDNGSFLALLAQS